MPDSYVEETHNGPRPIEGVSTGAAGFVGCAKKGVDNRPVLITSWAEFVQEFGRYTPDTPYLATAVCGFFENGGSRRFVVKTKGTDYMGADNGTGNSTGLPVLNEIDEISISRSLGEVHKRLLQGQPTILTKARELTRHACIRP